MEIWAAANGGRIRIDNHSDAFSDRRFQMESDSAPLVFAYQQQLGWRAFDQLRKGSQIHSDHENGDRAVLQAVLGYDILQNKMATHARTEGVDQSGSASCFAKVQLYDQAA